MGGCQNYGPFLGTLNIRCRTIIGTQKGTIILITTHMKVPSPSQQVSLGLRAFFPAPRGWLSLPLIASQIGETQVVVSQKRGAPI